MAFRNVTVEIAIGNVESRILGPVPAQLLDRALNPHLPSLQVSHEGTRPTLSCVFEPSEASFLTGALPAVKRALRRAGVRFRVRDRRHVLSRSGNWKLTGWDLRDYQQEVVDEAVRVGHGIIDIGTSGGKTILAAATIARLGLPALYLVTTRTLLHQTVEALERYLGVRPGVVGDGVCDPRPLTVGLVQGVALDAPFLARWSGGTLVFDEGHHAAARTFLKLVRTVAPRHHYYLSAVPFRTGGRPGGARRAGGQVAHGPALLGVVPRGERLRLSGRSAHATLPHLRGDAREAVRDAVPRVHRREPGAQRAHRDDRGE